MKALLILLLFYLRFYICLASPSLGEHKAASVSWLHSMFSINAVTISKSGKPACAIVCPKGADKLEILAAEELKKYLEEITTAKYEIISESALNHAKFKNYICAATKKSSGLVARLAPGTFGGGLKPDGYFIYTASEKSIQYVLISGPTPKSALNGAYGFIEEILRVESDRALVDKDYKLDSDNGIEPYLMTVAEQYPEAKGLHFRVWGSESAPDPANKSRRGELIKTIIKGMVASAAASRPDLKFLISEYTEMSDPDLTFLPQLKAITPHLVLQRKWDGDWGASNDPKIPAKPLWLKANDGVPRTVSHSIPSRKDHFSH